MYHNRPVIGVTPLYDTDKRCFWVAGYMTSLEKAGAVPLLLPLSADTAMLEYFADSCDGFIISGSNSDIDPALYGETPRYDNCRPSFERDTMDFYFIREALRRDQPLLGICRGEQCLNVALGGTLYQNIDLEFPGVMNHARDEVCRERVHEIVCPAESPLAKIVGKERFAVNSCHHQAVKALSPQLRCGAVAPDGVIEAIYHPEHKFMIGVQYHPELLYDTAEETRSLFAAFLDACRS